MRGVHALFFCFHSQLIHPDGKAFQHLYQNNSSVISISDGGSNFKQFSIIYLPVVEVFGQKYYFLTISLLNNELYWPFFFSSEKDRYGRNSRYGMSFHIKVIVQLLAQLRHVVPFFTLGLVFFLLYVALIGKYLPSL